MEASPPTGRCQQQYQDGLIARRTRHATRAERVNAREIRGRKIWLDEAHIPRPLAADSSRADHRGGLDTRDIAAENVVVEHITGDPFLASFVDPPSSPPQTVPSWSSRQFTHQGTASAYRCWTRDAPESPR
jgi:hypothetical protein